MKKTVTICDFCGKEEKFPKERFFAKVLTENNRKLVVSFDFKVADTDEEYDLCKKCMDMFYQQARGSDK